ncbi:MAG: hypothetical protein ABSD46_09290 [Bacteroidota bacterium]
MGGQWQKEMLVRLDDVETRSRLPTGNRTKSKKNCCFFFCLDIPISIGTGAMKEPKKKSRLKKDMESET